ncbi:MAG: hypothetical protein ACI4EX_02990 [Lachnospiraceae bacterium]
MYCSNCGKEIKGQGNYCEYCGASKMGGSDKQVLQNSANMGINNSLPQNNIVHAISNKIGNGWISVLTAFLGALFILFPICTLENVPISAFSYFEQFAKERKYAGEYWLVDLDLWIVLVIIFEIACIYNCYKVLQCIANERYFCYLESYSKYASISTLAATVAAFIFSIRLTKMYDSFWGFETEECSCSLWVWVFAIIAIINILILSKKCRLQRNQSEMYQSHNIIAQMAYEKENKNAPVNSTWVCKKCGMVNANYTGTCSCGNPKYNN